MTQHHPRLRIAARLSTAATLLALLVPPIAAERLTFDLIFGDHPAGRGPTQIAWAPEGARLAYLWGDEDTEATLRLFDVASGSERTVFDPTPLEGFALAGFHWSPDGTSLLIESKKGDLYLQPAAGGALRRLTETDPKEEDPKFSPDGASVAFVREANLYVLRLATGEVRALTTDGQKDRILNGVTDWVYWEELWGRDSTGYWWSPDSARIAYYRFDESPVRGYPLVDFSAVYPTVEWQKYPAAGEANPIVRVGVLDLEDGTTTWLETGEGTDVYLPRVEWLPGADTVAVQRLDRDQNRLDLLVCDAARGSCAELLREQWPTWINIADDLAFLEDGRFVWGSERSGWRRLYLYAADGRLLRELSPEGMAVTSLDGLIGADGALVYTAYSTAELGAANRRVFRQALAGGPPRELAPARGWSTGNLSQTSGLWVHGWSSLDQPARAVVRDANGGEVARLPSAAPRFDPASLPRWELLTIPGPDGSRLPAALLRPAASETGQRHPVIMYHYGGPGSQVVADRWGSRERSLWHALMAQRGYGVLKVDNRASLFFGKRGEDRVHRRFGPENLASQRSAVAYLQGLDWVDPQRIGLWGWSGGGANTLYALTNSPGTWAAGVAGAPVTDWRLYDTIWTERYLDHPADNPDGYRDSSAVTHAANLADPLLIVHGTADDNVHPHNTLQMIESLVEAGRRFEDAIYPRQKHGFTGASSRHFYERMTEFFDRHLLARR